MTALSKRSQSLLFCAYKLIVFFVRGLWPSPKDIKGLYSALHICTNSYLSRQFLGRHTAVLPLY